MRVSDYRAGFALAAVAAADFFAQRVRPIPQGAGQYWKPIEPEKIAVAQAKVVRQASSAASIADRMAAGAPADQITAELLARKC